MKLNIHLNGFAMLRPLDGKYKVSIFYFAREIGEKCGNKQNHPIKIDSLFT